MSENLLLKFRARNSPYGVTRDTVKALSEATAMSETMVIHLAISRFAREVLPAYEADDGPLSAAEFARVSRTAKSQLPKGKAIRRKSLI